MSQHPIDGILFDIDDTLVDTRGAFGTALATIARRYLPDVTPDRDADLVTFWRADANDHFGAVHARRDRSGRAADVPGQRAARASSAARPWTTRASRRGTTVFDTTFREAWSAHEDVDAVLERLLDAGLHVGALTNAALAYQTDKLERTGLADRVPLLVGLDTLGFGKPDPRVFVEACRRLGTDPARTAYVGDELDVDAARRARRGPGRRLAGPARARAGVPVERRPDRRRRQTCCVIASLDRARLTARLGPV